MSKIIIYGGQGYVGKNIIRKLQKKYRIFNISPSKTKRNKDLGYRHISGRLWDVFPEIKKVAPDYFIIVFFGNPANNSARLYEKIISSVLKVNEILPKLPVFIFLSSQLVYGNDKNNLKSETDKLHPISLYAKKCAKMERMLQKKAKKWIIFRVPFLYGNNRDVSNYANTFHKFIKTAKKGGDIKIFGTGDQIRTVLHIKDLVSLIENVLELGFERRIINASAEEFLSIANMAGLIARKFKIRVEKNLDWPSELLKLEACDIKLSGRTAKKLFKQKFRLKSVLKILSRN